MATNFDAELSILVLTRSTFTSFGIVVRCEKILRIRKKPSRWISSMDLNEFYVCFSDTAGLGSGYSVSFGKFPISPLALARSTCVSLSASFNFLAKHFLTKLFKSRQRLSHFSLTIQAFEIETTFAAMTRSSS